ncbi:site-specific integrase [Flavobacteriaceae bacterium]|nr:site-specific integrase [Flavobacteriaceae bacterium]
MSRIKTEYIVNINGTTSIRLRYNGGRYTDIDGKVKQHRPSRVLDFHLITNPRTPIERHQNKDIKEKVQLIANQWEKRIINEEYNLEDTEKSKTIVYAYLVKEVKRIKDKSSRASYTSMLSHFQKFFPKAITLKKINKREEAKGFYDYLTDKAIKVDGENLSIASANKYFKRLRFLLKEAKEEGYIQDLKFNVKLLPETKPEIVYLTIEEFRKLENTEEKNSTLKNAFLFACLTALRIGDLNKLTWGEIVEDKDDKGNLTIEYNRIMDKKPNGKQRRIRNYFDIYAKKYLGERQNDSDKVFPSLPQDASSKFNLKLREWILRAGISKHITFHCAKDSFAMYHIIHKEVGVFQLSGLLNHTDIRSSMHYYDLCAPELKKKLVG